MLSVAFYGQFSSQSRHEKSHCYANTLHSKERSNRLLTVSHQKNPKPVFKYSPVSKTRLQQR